MGTLIIFIAMLLVAGITASVIIQTMNSYQQQALRTATETIQSISSGLKVTHVSGYYNGSMITQLAFFITPIAGSESIDIKYTYLSISDSTNKIVLSYSNNSFSPSVSNGLFGTLNASNLTSSTFGVMVIRDIDSSCSANNPIINNGDLLVLLINTTACFSGIDTNTDVSGNVVPENGISGSVAFKTPSFFSSPIIDLYP
ncbi:MAG: flagellin [Candidatus Thermoplasmatota archaeon]|nr:flagellin [Candidatus Thermoplasmatota archaeon]